MTLLFSSALVGVDCSSLAPPLVNPPVWLDTGVRAPGVLIVFAFVASLGVKGGLAVLLVASVGITGRPGPERLDRSPGMLPVCLDIWKYHRTVLEYLSILVRT